MTSFLFLIYTNTLVTITFILCFGLGAALLLKRFNKITNLYSAVLPIGMLMYFAIMFSPTPVIVDREIINMMELLEQNKVNSNAMINSVLIPCINRDIKGLYGLHVKDVQEAFLKDIQDKAIIFSPSPVGKLKLKTNDICEVAWYYNQLKGERLKSKIT